MKNVFLTSLILFTASLYADDNVLDPAVDPKSNIQYETPEEARSALVEAGATFTRLNNDLSLAEIGKEVDYQMWIFTEDGHPAHPAVLKYEIRQYTVKENYIQLSSLCFGDKTACKKLYDHYHELFTN